MKIYDKVEDLIGNTPLFRPVRFENKHGITGRLLVKPELFNPAGSVKDRAALSMLETAEKQGKIKAGTVIIEPTSGNTGIGLAAICAAKGYKIILTMPETMSMERRMLLKAYGAQLVLTPGEKGMRGAIEKAEELAGETENSFIPSQFENPANSMAHFNTTGPEFWEQSGGEIDIFTACVGTGGTVTGVGSYLKKMNPKIEIVPAEPDSSPVLSGGQPAPHKIQGIGAGFVPGILDTSLYSRVIRVKNEDAFKYSREFAVTEGLLVGISSGAALYAAVTLALENPGKTVATLLPDTGERYLSSGLFD